MVSNWFKIIKMKIILKNILIITIYLININKYNCNSTINNKNNNDINHWAIIVDTSRFWFNYRHISNALSIYQIVKRLGIPDNQIILMLADQIPCNPRNCYPGTVFNDFNKVINIYDEDIEVDYKGMDVSVANFIKVLTGRHEEGTSMSNRLDSNENSNIMIYMTGHGGDGFLKFQDFEEISSPDIAYAIHEMYLKKRYRELLFIVDTCQAGSLANDIFSDNIIFLGSSKTGENSYAQPSDPKVGVSIIDRFTSATFDYVQELSKNDINNNKNNNKNSLLKLFNFYDKRYLHSTATWRIDLYKKNIKETKVTDFFGSFLKMQAVENHPNDVHRIVQMKEQNNENEKINKDSFYNDIFTRKYDGFEEIIKLNYFLQSMIPNNENNEIEYTESFLTFSDRNLKAGLGLFIFSFMYIIFF